MESLWCLCDHETDTESISHDNVLFYINYLHKFQTLSTSSQHAVSVEAEKPKPFSLFTRHGNILLS